MEHIASVEKTGGEAIKDLLSAVNVDHQLAGLKKEVHETKSPSKRDTMLKQIKYLSSLQKMGMDPHEAYILHHVPIIPPIARPPINMPGNRIEYADTNILYKESILANEAMKGIKDELPDSMITQQRGDLYNGVKAVMGLGDALSGSSRGKNLKGFLKQIAGETGPKTGFFQSKILSKKQDFSGRATISAEASLGFNEASVPESMLWTMYNYHIIRELVKNGYQYSEAKKAVEEKTPAAQAVFNKVVKEIPIILNRAPTLMRSNITAVYPVPSKGQTIGMNVLHLPLFAGDFDGDAVSVYCPQSPEAVHEARQKLLPQSQIYDFRKGLGNSLIMPGHEAIIGSHYLTSPDTKQKTVEFDTEEAALAALKAGEIKPNTPIKIKSHGSN